MAVAAILIASLTLHVTGTASRGTSGACGFTVSAKVAEGGRQVTCLTSVRGYPGPGSVIRSAGTMTFVLSRGTIRTRVAITQRFAKNGSSATQTLTGRIVGGAGAYAGARGKITGGGTLVDTSNALRRLRLTYRLTF
jgi:hypothetical protein